jgi:hypothetical protein
MICDRRVGVTEVDATGAEGDSTGSAKRARLLGDALIVECLFAWIGRT